MKNKTSAVTMMPSEAFSLLLNTSHYTGDITTAVNTSEPTLLLEEGNSDPSNITYMLITSIPSSMLDASNYSEELTTLNNPEFNSTLNVSEPALLNDGQSAPGLFQLILQILLSGCIFGLNLLILAVVFIAKDMKQVTCYFISHLAMGDLCFGLALILRCVLAAVKPSSMYPCRVVLSLAVMSGITSLIGILLLCWQTYLAVKKMTPFHLAIPVTTARVCIVVTWILACLIGFLNIRFTADIPTADASTRACFFGSGYTDTRYLVFLTSIILFTFIFISYSQIVTMILLHKRQRIIAPSVTVTTAPEGAMTQSLGHGIDSFRRSEYMTPSDKKREFLPSGEREGVFGVIGRQGSVNEIKLQINNGVSLGVENHHGGFYTSNNHLTPMTFLAKGNDVKDLLSTGPPTRVTSPNSGDSSFNCSTCVPHGQDAGGQHGADNNSVGKRLKVTREYHKNKKITRAHVRVMAIISTILVVFTIGWVPYMIALFLYAMCDDNHCGVNAKILSGLLNLCVLQSFSNFFVYFVKDATFKFRVKQICSFGKNLGFINRVGAAKSADHGMFGVAVGKRNRKHGGGGGATAARKRTRRTERRSDSKGLQLQSVSC